MKQRVLDVGDKAKILDKSQLIEESAFGKGSKSVIRIDGVNGDDEDKLVTEDTLKNKMMDNPVFEMVSFPRHNNMKPSISEVNRKAEQNVDEEELRNRKNGMNDYNKMRNAKVQCQRVYGAEDDTMSEEKPSMDGWSVILDGGESVHSDILELWE